MSRNIAFLLFDDAEELDFVGPWEVFTMLRYVDPDLCSAFTVSEKGGEVRCAKGMRVVVDYAIDDAPAADIVLIPGGQGTRVEVDNARLIDYIKRCAEKAELMTSVCTGAFMLERAGLLEGKKATTHWAALGDLRGSQSVTVVDDQRWVDEGNVITASGVSAGIDMALHVVGRLWGPETARNVQKFMEYYPAPPYAEVAEPVAP